MSLLVYSEQAVMNRLILQITLSELKVQRLLLFFMMLL